MKKRRSSALIAILAFSLIAIYGFIPFAQAASLTSVKDTLSDSTTSAANVTQTVTFTTGTSLTQTQYMEVDIPSGFTNVTSGKVTCPTNSTAGVTGAGPFVVKCVVDNGQTIAAGAQTITIASTTNATAGSYTIGVYTKTGGDVEIEKAQAKVFILDNVAMSASVDASLTFAVTGLNAQDTVNGVTVTATSTATTTPFGTLSTSVSSTVGQQLAVSTNATDGYKVTVQQNRELTSAGSAKINSFRDSQIGAGSTTAAVWATPANLLGNADTYGHMGLTSSDASLSTGGDFSGSKYKGLNGTAPMEVMYHNGPSNSTVDGIGLTKVGYTVQITALQEAGDYTSTLTYVCTPQF